MVYRVGSVRVGPGRAGSDLARGQGGNPLLPNCSETDFYRIDAGNLWMVYLFFIYLSALGTFLVVGGGGLVRKKSFVPNSSDMA